MKVSLNNITFDISEDLRGNILKAIDTQIANGENEYVFSVNTAIFARWLLWYYHLKA